MATKELDLINGFLVTLGKTPKQFVIEECVKRKLEIKWDWKEITKTPSKFYATCNIWSQTEMYTSEGNGRSIKQAEHQAALNIVSKLFTTEELLRIAKGDSEPKKQMIVATATGESDVSDIDEPITGEPIGDLITLCRRNNLQIPQYMEDHKRGPDNTNIFTVTCTVESKAVKRGRRLRKLDAKKVAAFKVLKALNVQLAHETIAKGIPASSGESSKTELPNKTEDEKMNEQFLGKIKDFGEPTELWRKFATDLKIKYRFVTSIQLTDGMISIFLMINFPDILIKYLQNLQTHTVNGVGSSLEEAKQNATIEALKFAKDMLCDADVFKDVDYLNV